MTVEIDGKMISAIPTSTALSLPASPSDVAAFTRALGEASAVFMPEERVITILRNQSQEVDTKLEIESNQIGVLNDPMKMMVAQSNVLRSIAEVELTAKMAGLASQAIHKLISMQ